MRISLATNFENDLIDCIKDYPVEELFGKLSRDVTGGGRAAYQIVDSSRRRIARHVDYAKRHGIRFNYLLNAACLDNREFTRKGQKAIRALLDWISSSGIEAVTISSPFLLRIVKTRYPHLRTRVSVFASVDHVRKAKMWEDEGADCIMLDSLQVNREFALLAAIRKAVGCDLELMVNNYCIQSCAYAPYHNATLAHSSQSGHHSKGFFIDWCFLRCSGMKIEEAVNYLRAEWIRPEDLHLYEELGYDRIKIVERGAPTPVLLERVKAYAARRYDGNLLDLIQPFGFRERAAKAAYYNRGMLWRMRYLLRPLSVAPSRMWNLKRLADERGMLRPVDGDPPVFIDNRALDGFMERFKDKGCKEVDCEQCRYCHRWAERSVHIDAGHRQRCRDIYGELFDDLHTGRMWGLSASPAVDNKGKWVPPSSRGV